MADNQIPYEEDLGLSQPEPAQLQSTQPTETQEPEYSEAESLADPADVLDLGLSIRDKRLGYDESIAALSDYYKNTKFTDPQEAGENFGMVADAFNQAFEVKPKPTINASASKLAQQIADPNLEDNLKIKAVEDWREEAKYNLYNSNDTQKLIGAKKSEELIDDYAMQFRREIYGKDRNAISDALIRGAETAIHPITGTVDSFFGTEIDKPTMGYLAEGTNPDLDNSYSALAGSVAGNIVGAVGASVNPASALGYLGAMLVSEGKDVYDEAYKETGSDLAAKGALLKSTPGIALQAFSDRFVGESFGQYLRTGKGFSGALKGFASEAAAESFDYLNTQIALESTTGNPKYAPTAEEFIKQGLIGGVVGGGFGAVEGIQHSKFEAFKAKVEASVDAANTKFKAAQGVITVPEVAGVSPEIIEAAKEYKANTLTEEDLTRQTLENDIARAKEQSTSDKTETEKERDLLRVAALELQLKSLPGPVENDLSPYDYDAGLNKESESYLGQFVKPTFTEDTDPINFSDGPIEAEAEPGADTNGNAESSIIEETDEPIGPDQKLFNVDYTRATPIPAMLHLVRSMDGILQLGRNVRDMGGAFGFFTEQGPRRIKILAPLFKDLGRVYNVMAHEVGHMIDATHKILTNPQLSPAEVHRAMRKEALPMKLVGWYSNLLSSIDTSTLTDSARELSALWRPYGGYTAKMTNKKIAEEVKAKRISPSDAKHMRYRNRSTEVFADVASAILVNPEMVQASHPKVWEAYQKGLAANPEALKTAQFIDKLKTDQIFFAEWLQANHQKGRVREAEAVRGATETRLKKQYGVAAHKQKSSVAVSESVRNLFSRFNFGKKTAESVATDEAEEALGKIMLYGTAHTRINAELIQPIGRILDDATKLGIEIKDLETFEEANRILNETTRTLENIKADPVRYKQALDTIKEDLVEYHNEVETTLPSNILKIDTNNLTPDNDLSDNAAKLFAGFPEQRGIYTQLQAHYLEEGMLPEYELLNSSAYDVRKYLGNPEGRNKHTAASSMVALKAKYNGTGVAKFSDLENFSKAFHNITGKNLDKLYSAGLLSDDLYDHMKLNKYNYVTFNILKYFEEDPTVSAAIKKQYGTLEESGDVLASTINKTAALQARAEYQQAQNKAISLARMADYTVEEVKPKGTYGYTKEGLPSAKFESIYETRDRLQKDDKESSYLIEYEQGKPTLYKINSPEFAKMFEKSALQKDDSTIGNILRPFLDLFEGFNKIFLEREFKTIFSPIFVVRQRETDKSAQAYIAKSKYPRFFAPFFHVDPALRRVTKLGKEIERVAREENVFTPEYQHLVDLGVIGIDAASISGKEGGASFDPISAIYQEAGVEIPGAADFSYPVAWNNKANAFLEKIPFTGTAKRWAEIDERRAKIIGYLIGRDILGMSEARAARLAKEEFGTPDPQGGGVQSDTINKAFLFGRANFNGSRAFLNQLGRDKLGYGAQFIFRKVIPRLIMSGAVMAPLVAAMFGDEEGEKYKKVVNKIPSWDKVGKFVIPIGVNDPNNEFKFLSEVTSEEIGPDWKTAYFKLPIARELQHIGGLIEPLIQSMEDLIETKQLNLGKLATGTVGQFTKQFSANFAPAISAGSHIYQFASGANPVDTFRNKEIISKDVFASGEFLAKAYEYLAWSAATTAPSIFSLPQKSGGITESLDPLQDFGRYIGAEGKLENFVADLGASSPIAVVKGFFGKTSYGDYERSNTLEDRKKATDASVRLGMGENTKILLNEYRKSEAQKSDAGKDWRRVLPRETVQKIQKLNNWHSQAYKRGFQSSLDAYEAGDSEDLLARYEKLEAISTRYLEGLTD